MKRAIQVTGVCSIILFLNLICFAQSTTPNTQLEQQQRIEQIKREQKAYERQILGRNRRYSRRVFRQGGKVLRYPNKKTLEVMSPSKDLFLKYKSFLKGKKTGLTKLNSAVKCGIDARVLIVNEECIRFEKIPSYGSSFSFRVGRYATRPYSDVLFKDGVLFSSGNSTIGFLTNLGDVPIDNISSKTTGANYIYEFVPETEVSEIEKQNSNLVKSVKIDGSIYRKYLKISQGNTYLLRSIAYKVKKKKFEKGRRIRINNTSVDKRLDIVLAFRVIELDTDGSVTLLWKVLKSKKSPKLNMNSK